MATSPFQPTNSVEQDPSWAADSYKAHQETQRIFIEPEDSLPFAQEITPMITILSQINPAHTLISCFFKIYFDIIPTSKPRFTESADILKDYSDSKSFSVQIIGIRRF
jgi:hypothetical protein